MRYFDHIVSALVVSGAAALAAGCAMPADEDTTDAQEACGDSLLPGVQQGLEQGGKEFNKKEMPSKGEFNKKQPTIGQGNEYAPVQQLPSKGEFNKKQPTISQELPSKGEFNKKQPTIGQEPIKGEFNKKQPSFGQGGGGY